MAKKAPLPKKRIGGNAYLRSIGKTMIVSVGFDADEQAVIEKARLAAAGPHSKPVAKATFIAQLATEGAKRILGKKP